MSACQMHQANLSIRCFKLMSRGQSEPESCAQMQTLDSSRLQVLQRFGNLLTGTANPIGLGRAVLTTRVTNSELTMGWD